MTSPKTGTREWAPHSANICQGCANFCSYCYAHAMARRFGRVRPGEWANERVDLAKAHGR